MRKKAQGSDFCWKLALGDFEGGLIFTLSYRIEYMYSFPLWFIAGGFRSQKPVFLVSHPPPPLASPAPLSPTALLWLFCWGLSWLGYITSIFMADSLAPLYHPWWQSPSTLPSILPRTQSPCCWPAGSWKSLLTDFAPQVKVGTEQKIGIGFIHCSKISLSI